MTLFERMSEHLVLYSQTRQPDGYGGYTDALMPGKDFDAAVTTNVAASRDEAQAANSFTTYRITAPVGTGLMFHDIVKRDNGQYLRVTTNASDNATPAVAGFQFENVEAEEWKQQN